MDIRVLLQGGDRRPAIELVFVQVGHLGLSEFAEHVVRRAFVYSI